MSWLLNRVRQAVRKTDDDYPGQVPFDDSPCTGCDSPCSHAQVPDYLKIDYDSPLVGSVKAYGRHLVYCEGEANRWPAKLDAVDDSTGAQLMAAASAAGSRLGYRVVVTACDVTGAPLPHALAGATNAAATGDKAGSREAEQANGQAEAGGAMQLLLFPDMHAVRLRWDGGGGAGPEQLREWVEEYLAQGTLPPGAELQRLGGDSASAAISPTATTEGQQQQQQEGGAWGNDRGGGPHFVLVCSHKLRDKRCGVVGPLLVEALRQAARERGLEDKVYVYPVSHTGGHKFAGNIIIYPGGHWYGRVKPCHADAILDRHILGGKVIKDLWRGRISSNSGSNAAAAAAAGKAGAASNAAAAIKW